MNYGKCWLVIEEYFHGGKKSLVSIIRPRKVRSYVRDYVEQMYVDKFASFNEKIAYKKNQKVSPFKVEEYGQNQGIISCGHEPTFRAYFCHKLKLKGRELTYTYRVYREDNSQRIAKEITETINVS